MPFTYYILVYLYYDAVIICCICMFYFSKYGGAINKQINNDSLDDHDTDQQNTQKDYD